MKISITRRDAIDLYQANNGLNQYSTQAGFYLAMNNTILSKFAREHDSFLKTLKENYAKKDNDGKLVKDEHRNLIIEGDNLVSFEADYERYLDEKIEIDGLRQISVMDLRVRVTDRSKSELVTPDLPGSLLQPCIEHGLITILSGTV